jgi:hypothetical protein
MLLQGKKYLVCSFFNDAFSSSDYITSRDGTINNELERTWKKEVMA